MTQENEAGHEILNTECQEFLYIKLSENSCKRISIEWVQFSRSRGGKMKQGCGTELGMYCMFYCEHGNENHQAGAGYSILERIISAVKKVEFVSIIIQQTATIYSLFISANCSTCFGWYLHPSSGAHITVSTVFGIIETVTATCREHDWMGTVPIQSRAPDDGWRYHPKHIKQFADINKLYFVASCWIIIDIYSAMHGPLNIKEKE